MINLDKFPATVVISGCLPKRKRNYKLKIYGFFEEYQVQAARFFLFTEG